MPTSEPDVFELMTGRRVVAVDHSEGDDVSVTRKLKRYRLDAGCVNLDYVGIEEDPDDRLLVVGTIWRDWGHE